MRLEIKEAQFLIQLISFCRFLYGIRFCNVLYVALMCLSSAQQKEKMPL